MEDPIAHLLIRFISTDGFPIWDLQVRALSIPNFFIGLVFIFSYPRDYFEIKGLVGRGHAFQGKIRDLGWSYRVGRNDSVTPVRETGATQVTPVQWV